MKFNTEIDLAQRGQDVFSHGNNRNHITSHHIKIIFGLLGFFVCLYISLA